MRDFFINCFEIILSLVIAMVGVGVAVAAIGALMGPVQLGSGLPPAQGPLAAIMIFLGGMLTLLVLGGALFLGLGIYRNTARTADALELLIALRR
ncbi:MAG: hypothetical protein WBA67_15360 [Jannaschia sp.]